MTTYTYDAALRLVGVTNRSGQATSYIYDSNDRMISATLPGGLVQTYTYDALGWVLTAANPDSRLSYTYDASGNVVSARERVLSPASLDVTLSYTYDLAGNRTSITGPAGRTAYTFDASGRPTAVTDPAGLRTTVTYDPLQRLASLGFPNGVSQSFAYDPSSFLTGVTSKLGSATLASASYTSDANGARASMTDLTGTTSYTQDSVGRLTSVSPPGGGSTGYGYDAVGNRTSSTGAPAGPYVYDAANRLTTDGVATYTYDAEGSILTRTDAAGVTRYTWNGDNRLTAVTLPGGSQITYRYDAFGRRIETTAGGTATRFVYDGPDIAAEFDGVGNLLASYVDLGGIDSTLAMTRGGQSFYYSRDGGNNVVALTDASGAVVQRYSYSPFGLPTSTGSIANRFTFAGREYDSAAGLYYFRDRYYDPRIGRFLSQDPAASASSYTYAQNNPVNMSDPTGNMAAIETGQLYTNDVRQSAQLDEVSSLLEQLASCAEQLFAAALVGALTGEVMDFLGAIGSDATGGVYEIRDRSGEVARTGRTNDVGAREGQLTGPGKPAAGMEFSTRYPTDSAYLRRGLEQRVYAEYPGAKLNGSVHGRPVTRTNLPKLRKLTAGTCGLLAGLLP